MKMYVAIVAAAIGAQVFGITATKEYVDRCDAVSVTNVKAWVSAQGYETATNAAATYQPLIGDLATIRAGAAAGATAVQEESDPTATAKAQAAIAAAGCVVTNADGVFAADFVMNGSLYVGPNVSISDTSGEVYATVFACGSGSVAVWDCDKFRDSAETWYYYMPWSSLWGYEAAEHSIAKLSDIPAAQIQSDWSQGDMSAVDYIKNKPAIPTAYLASASATATSITVTPNTGAAVSLAVEYEYATRSVAAPASVTCVSGEIVTATGVNGTLNVVFPAEVANKSADFILRVVATGASQLGTLTITGGGTVTPEWLCDALTTTGKIAANKTTYIFFSRVAANTYVINSQEVK